MCHFDDPLKSYGIWATIMIHVICNLATLCLLEPPTKVSFRYYIYKNGRRRGGRPHNELSYRRDNTQHTSCGSWSINFRISNSQVCYSYYCIVLTAEKTPQISGRRRINCPRLLCSLLVYINIMIIM